jgi:dipeptidyl aminopeptidase/acylaminoacyl peptidase
MFPRCRCLCLFACLAVAAGFPAGSTRPARNGKATLPVKLTPPGRTDGPLPPGALARLGKFDRQGQPITGLAFSPDGKAVAWGKWETLHLSHSATGKELRRFAGHDGMVGCVAFSPDGKLLVTGDWHGTVRLWGAGTGKEIRRLKGHQGAVAAVAFSPDGKTLASGGARQDRTIRLWDVATGTSRATLRPRDDLYCGVSALCFSPDGKTLASSGRPGEIFGDDEVRLWDLATGRELRTVKHERSFPCAVAISPDGKLLASAGANVRLWEVATGKPRGLLRLGVVGFQSVAFSPDGKTLAVGGCDSTVRLWEMATGKERGRLAGHDWWVSSLAFSPDGKTLAAGNWGSTLLLWDLRSLGKR